ncbi:MAG: ribosome maturation factor RimP [Bacilli bacterium]|nr:ribosome maturation factor RimP [Bacilli bacterium]
MGQIENVRKLLEPVLEKEGYELTDCNLYRGKDGLTLELVVDRDTPIDLEAIVKVSDIINPILDKEDPISEAYMLDVSSAGSEKPLKLEKLPKYVGEYINIHLINPYKGENYLEGDLLEIADEEITLGIKEKGRNKKVTLTRQDVDKARLAIKF